MGTSKSDFLESGLSPCNWLMSLDRYTCLVLGIGLVWGVYDPISTYIAVAVSGSIQYEANPLVRAVLDIHPGLLFPLKFIAIGSVLTISIKGKKHIKQLAYWDIFFIGWCLFGMIITVINIYVAYQLSSLG